MVVLFQNKMMFVFFLMALQQGCVYVKQHFSLFSLIKSVRMQIMH